MNGVRWSERLGDSKQLVAHTVAIRHPRHHTSQNPPTELICRQSLSKHTIYSLEQVIPHMAWYSANNHY